jgi:tetratricopeptide (TPR) repeat protein
VAGLFALAAVGVLAVVYLLVLQLGLPTWVFYGAIVLLATGLPIMLLTGRHERKRAIARATGVMTATPATGMQRHFTWRKALIGSGVAFGALTVVAGFYMAMRLLGIGPVGTLVAAGVLDEQERIVLARFDNTSPDTTLAETVTELFHIDLTQSPTVTVMEASQVSGVLRRMERDPEAPLTPELALDVAEREGIKAVITGEIRTLAGGYVLSARLTAMSTGDVLWAGRETADGASEVIAAVDRLSASLREKIGESLRTIRGDPPLDRVTTRSTVALRKLVEGARANDLGDVDRAIALLEEAVAEDSGFAMAWRKLGIVLNNTGRDDERRDSALATAMRLGDRLSERERYLTEGTYYQLVEDDDQAAIAAYRSVLDRYPNDRIALNNLGNIYSSLGRQEEALELRIRSVALGHAPAVTYQGAILSLYGLGQADSAGRVLDLYSEEYPGQPVMLRFRAEFASARGAYDSARAILEEMRSSQRGNPQWEMQAAFGLSDIAAVQGKLTEGWRHLRAARDNADALDLTWTREQPREYWEGQVRAWELLWFDDDPAAAIREMDAALARYPLDSLAPEDRQYFNFVNFYARAGRPERAREFLAAFETDVDAETREDRVEGWHFARGSVAQAEGRYQDAIVEYRQFREGLPGCVMCGLFTLARAFDRAGEADSAQAYYERYLDAPQLFRAGNDNNNLWLTLRRLGELHEERGEREQAMAYYNRFVELWGDADPKLQPYVEDVRGRIARLVGEG